MSCSLYSSKCWGGCYTWFEVSASLNNTHKLANKPPNFTRVWWGLHSQVKYCWQDTNYFAVSSIAESHTPSLDPACYHEHWYWAWCILPTPHPVGFTDAQNDAQLWWVAWQSIDDTQNSACMLLNTHPCNVLWNPGKNLSKVNNHPLVSNNLSSNSLPSKRHHENGGVLAPLIISQSMHHVLLRMSAPPSAFSAHVYSQVGVSNSSHLIKTG